MKLYTYYRSSASYRVRIALNYKNIEHELIPVNLIQQKQLTDAYKTHNRQGRVPTLSDGQFEVGQSAAILEYLEEKYPKPPLLPVEITARAWVRYLSQIICCDIHPLNNSSVLNFLKDELSLNAAQIKKWYHHWVKQGFDTLEAILSNHPNCGDYCWGDHPTMADVCLIPQIFNAHRFNVPMETYPTLQRINAHCLTLACFQKAMPEQQPDYQDQKTG